MQNRLCDIGWSEEKKCRGCRETIEQAQCDTQCDVDTTRDMNHGEQQIEQGKAVYF